MATWSQIKGYSSFVEDSRLNFSPVTWRVETGLPEEDSHALCPVALGTWLRQELGTWWGWLTPLGRVLRRDPWVVSALERTGDR